MSWWLKTFFPARLNDYYIKIVGGVLGGVNVWGLIRSKFYSGSIFLGLKFIMGQHFYGFNVFMGQHFYGPIIVDGQKFEGI